ncbi:transmembrane and coiled-coil domain-containing protein 4 [Artemisia annua]|uniref:Transmembrane and coiled-coil domain-containing protein 4 n=1 Tax=Artemisia annua TaxID=35608 RepID=A0A2U1QHN4_ARTAN|nr:transmembrane and coiled-coil domain-containing protein 4 [Artemisia annua]
MSSHCLHILLMFVNQCLLLSFFCVSSKCVVYVVEYFGLTGALFNGTDMLALDVCIRVRKYKGTTNNEWTLELKEIVDRIVTMRKLLFEAMCARVQMESKDSNHNVVNLCMASLFYIYTLFLNGDILFLQKGYEKENDQTSDDSWEKLKRGGLIGTAAITGGTLMAITGGLAAPAIASGFGALAPTLDTIMLVIGAGGFAVVASAIGSVARSVAVAASLGVRMLLAIVLGSSFSPKFTNSSQNHTANFLKFTRTLLAFASDSHKYLISLHSPIVTSSTAPRCSMTSLHTSSVSPKIPSILNLVTDEATRIRLLNTLSPQFFISRILNEGSGLSETTAKLGQFLNVGS